MSAQYGWARGRELGAKGKGAGCCSGPKPRAFGGMRVAQIAGVARLEAPVRKPRADDRELTAMVARPSPDQAIENPPFRRWSRG